MAESSFKLENPLETMRAEENNSDTGPMVQESAAADSQSLIPDINKKKKKKIPKSKIFAVRVILLDPWNLRFKHPDEIAARRRDNPGMVKKRFRWSRETYQIDPWHLRETRPDYVPVSMEKDARSEIPDVGMKKYLVPKAGLLGDFVDFFRVWIGLSKKKPIFVYFKNTVPPTGAPICAIDEENKDEDGFLHMTYSGEDNFVYGSSEVEQVKVENAARSDFGIVNDEKKNPLGKRSRKRKYKRNWPIALLDSWNTSKRVWMRDGKRSLEGADLREKYPLCIPVSVEKDAGSDIPDIDMKKFLVPSEMPLGEFVYFLQGKSKKPMFVFFKNTEPPTGALMSAIDKENKDDDGYLHVIYSGNDKLCGYFGELKLSS